MNPALNAFLGSLADLGRSMDRLSRTLARAVDPSLRIRRWTAQEIKELRARFPDEPTAKLARDLGRPVASLYNLAHKLRVRKSAAFYASPASGRTNGRQGIGYRFRKGQASWNKGMKGLRTPGSEKGWFKKGAKPANTWKPIGTEVVTKDGYVVRKVTDIGGYNNNDWKFVHHLAWEKRRGPVPPGHALIFRNGNKRDFRIKNLQLLTRAQLMKKNSIHNYPEPIKDLIRWGGVLTRVINQRKRNEND